VVGLALINERRAVNLDASCGWRAQSRCADMSPMLLRSCAIERSAGLSLRGAARRMLTLASPVDRMPLQEGFAT